MTADEEDRFRQATRSALAQSRDILMVAAEDPDKTPPFTVLAFADSDVSAIVLPEALIIEEGTEERCQAILRQESKALAGEALD